LKALLGMMEEFARTRRFGAERRMMSMMLDVLRH
jgi:hypothetical protein